MKRNLLTILKSNGTGVLQGLCRPNRNQNQTFSKVLNTSNLLENKFCIHLVLEFSLGELHLGSYVCAFDFVEDNGGTYPSSMCKIPDARKANGYITFPENSNEKRVKIIVEFGIDEKFAKFTAILE
jgi:hypothetical protein